VPNPAPPRHPAVRRRVADTPRAADTAPAVPPVGDRAAPLAEAAAQPSAPLVGVPASWTGLGALLAGAGERSPADALTLATVAAGTARGNTGPQVDLSGIWALPADMAAARSHTVMRTLDGKGRLQLPVDADAAVRLPAERDGALVTVFLPGSPDRPRPNFTTTALPLDARGRLTVTAGVRRQAGIPEGADMLAVVDPDRRTVTLTAASRLAIGIADLLEALRRPVPTPAAHGDSDAVEATAEGTTVATGADMPGAGCGEHSAGRLHIVR
jgi:hypothetical protein